MLQCNDCFCPQDDIYTQVIYLAQKGKQKVVPKLSDLPQELPTKRIRLSVKPNKKGSYRESFKENSFVDALKSDDSKGPPDKSSQSSNVTRHSSICLPNLTASLITRENEVLRKEFMQLKQEEVRLRDERNHRKQLQQREMGGLSKVRWELDAVGRQRKEEIKELYALIESIKSHDIQ